MGKEYKGSKHLEYGEMNNRITKKKGWSNFNNRDLLIYNCSNLMIIKRIKCLNIFITFTLIKKNSHDHIGSSGVIYLNKFQFLYKTVLFIKIKSILLYNTF